MLASVACRLFEPVFMTSYNALILSFESLSRAGIDPVGTGSISCLIARRVELLLERTKLCHAGV